MHPVPPTGHWHEDYERGRPGYPLQAVHAAGVSSAADVLELGAGTGKLTRLLVDAFTRVIAVEPDEGMRRVLGRVCPLAEVHAGSAEAIPLANDSVDVVFAAEAFHWFSDEDALREIRRVLRPGGALVVMWNVPGGPTEPSIAEAERLLIAHAPPRDELGHDPVDLNADRFASGAWQAGLARPPFTGFGEARLPNPQTLDRGGLLAFFESMGWLGELPRPERERLLSEVRALLPAEQYRRQWETRVYWTRLRAGATR